MVKRKFSKVITANALHEGDVVYLTKKGTWTSRLQLSHVFRIATEAEKKLYAARLKADQVVDVYLADVRRNDGEITPVHFRENFRQTGPSNYFHGKQNEI